jgi:hypothetical protein
LVDRIKPEVDVIKPGDDVKTWIDIAGFAGWISEFDILLDRGIV